MSDLTPLIKILSDGKFHSGTAIGEALHVQRAAVWKWIEQVRSLGVTVDAVTGRGYRLKTPLELLDITEIESHLKQIGCDASLEIILEGSLGSTNSELATQSRDGAPSGRVLLAEYQTQGRGRNQRGWVSPFASQIAMSLLWRYNEVPFGLTGLSLVVGIAVAQALKLVGVGGIQLKWPNDIYCQGKKLGGILVEVQGEPSGPCALIIGVGINVDLRGAKDKVCEIDQPWIDCYSVKGGSVSRNELSASLIKNIVSYMEQFQDDGFGAFVDQWNALDYLVGQAVIMQLSRGEARGIARGVSRNGGLLIENDGQIQELFSGDASLIRGQ